MFKNISNKVNQFLQEDELWRLVRKTWVYKDKCFVVDFVYKGIGFNFDLSPSRGGLVSIELVQRKSISGSYLTPTDRRKTSIGKDVTIERALHLLQTHANQVLSRIDAYIDSGTISVVSPGNGISSHAGSSISSTALTVGVMTLPLHKNFGGNLQAFAMMEALRQLGHKPILINRRHPSSIHVENAGIDKEKVNESLWSNSYGMNASNPHSVFIDKHIAPVTRQFNSSSQLSDAFGHYNFHALIVGSDQVWRAKYARSILRDFFFAFLGEDACHIKRISYAASFGADKLAYGEDLPEVARLAKKFDAISVREDSGVALCKKHLGVNAQHVLDPTLLLSPDDYVRLFPDRQQERSGDRLLTYVLDADEDKNRVIDEVSRRLSLSAYTTSGLPFGSVSALKAGGGDRSIEGWLASFHGAAFVVTDSFHGVVFSILFNKPFIAYGNPKRGMARFSSLLKMFELEDRLVVHSGEIDIDNMLKPIDWSAVNDRLAELRGKSLAFLKSALSSHYSNDRQVTSNIVAASSSEDNRKSAIPNHANPLNVLCTGCGVCVSESRGSLKMAWNEDGFLVPQATSSSVSPDAVRVCPFNTNPDKKVEDEDALAKIFLPNARKFDPNAGYFENSYIGYSRQYRPTSSSGGIATYVFEKLMDRKVVDYLFVVLSDGANGYRYQVCKNIKDFRAISKTRYFPVSMDELFTIIDQTEGRVAVSGVACFIKAIRLKQHYRPEYREKIPFLVGIICGGLKSRWYTDFLAQSAQISGPYTSPEYRVKDPQSTASDYSFSAIDQESQVHSIKMRRVGNNWGAGLFKAQACDFCSDVLTELADISVGDAWLSKYKADGMGNSVVVTRSALADDIIRSGIMAGELVMEEAPIHRITESQSGGFNHKRKGLKFRVWMARYFSGAPIPRLRKRVLQDISVSEAVVQLHRERTRSKSLRYWKETRSSEAFKSRMRASRRALKIATAARKDGSNAALISIIENRRIDITLVDNSRVMRRQLMLRWLMRIVKGRQSNFGLMRAALFGAGPVAEQNQNEKKSESDQVS